MNNGNSENAWLSFKRMMDKTPGASIASIGLALSLYAYESQRMSSFQTVESGSLISSTPGIAALLVFVVFSMIIYRVRPSFRLHRSAFFGILVAGGYAAATLVLSGQAFGQVDSSFEFLARFVLRLSEMMLLVCWAESLIPLGSKRVAFLFAASLIVLGFINLLSLLIRAETAYIFVAAFPFISMTCLYWFKDHNASFQELYSAESSSAFFAFQLDQSLMPTSDSVLTKVSLGLIFLLPLLSLSFIFGHIHFTWVPIQDGSVVSFSVQLAAATGTALAGIILLLLVSFFWGRKKLQMYFLFVIPIVFLSLYIASFMSENAFFYVVPLNIAQKIAFFFIWLAPFLIPSKKSPMFIWCMALSFYQLGKGLSTLASTVQDSLFYTTCVIVFISIIIVSVTIGIIFDKGKRTLNTSEEDLNTSFEERIRTTINVEKNSLIPTNISLENDQFELRNRCNLLAHKFALTRREEEILFLLAEGMNAQAIAEVLVISTSTAKSHMRNIYAKLGIHTQNELLLLIHKKVSR